MKAEEAEDAIEAALLAEMRRAPGDEGPRLVYADHLVERGDVRGELIVLDHRERCGTLDDPAAIDRLLVLALRDGFPRFPDDPEAGVLRFEGGGSFPVQYDVHHGGHAYYLRYRHGNFSITIDDDACLEYELAVTAEGMWSFRETTAVLALVSEAIASGRLATLGFPDAHGLRAHPAYRAGRCPAYTVPSAFVAERGLSERSTVAPRDHARWYALWDRLRGVRGAPREPGCACGVPGLSCDLGRGCVA